MVKYGIKCQNKRSDPLSGVYGAEDVFLPEHLRATPKYYHKVKYMSNETLDYESLQELIISAKDTIEILDMNYIDNPAKMLIWLLTDGKKIITH